WRPNRREALAAMLGLALLASCGGDDNSSSATTAKAPATSGGGTSPAGTSAGGATATTSAGTTAGTAPGPPALGGQLTAIHVSNPSSLAPSTGNSGNAHMSLYPFYDRLVTFDPETLEPKPGLAESWAITPTALTLTLRSGVKFHDGTDFDATAVKFNLD